MADALTDFILKPTAPFAAGIVLFGVVWGFFKGVESVLTEDTKLEIAVWLLGMKPLGPKMEPWPETFAKLFDRVFTKKHVSLTCFWRSSLCSCAAIALTLLLGYLIDAPRTIFGISMLRLAHSDLIILLLLANFVP